MSASTKGFLHGAIYSFVSAVLLFATLPASTNLTGVWLGFVVLDVASCITYAALVVPPRHPVSGATEPGNAS